MNQSRRTAANRVAGSSSFHPATAQIDQLYAAMRGNSSWFDVAAVTCNLETLFEQMYRRDRTGPLLEDLMVEHRSPAPHAASSTELCS
jgi:hypothetical protein